MDFVESTKLQWTGRYSWGSEDQSTTGLGGVGSKILTGYEQYLGSNTRTLTPTLVNEARFGYTRLFNSIGTLSAFSTDVVAALGIPGLQPGASSTWGIPAISINGDGFSGIGDNTDGPYVIMNNSLQAVDNMSWIEGKHTFRFGFEYTLQNFNQVGNQFSRGNFVFQPNATQSPTHTGSDAFAEFLLGDLYQSTVAVAIASANYQRNVEAAFFDDTYKITRKVTLSLGLRYELTPPWTDQLGNDFTVALPKLFFGPQAPQPNGPTLSGKATVRTLIRASPSIGPRPAAWRGRRLLRRRCAATALTPMPFFRRPTIIGRPALASLTRPTQSW